MRCTAESKNEKFMVFEGLSAEDGSFGMVEDNETEENAMDPSDDMSNGGIELG